MWLFSLGGVFQNLSTVITCCNSLCINKYGNTKCVYTFCVLTGHETWKVFHIHMCCELAWYLDAYVSKMRALKGMRNWYEFKYIKGNTKMLWIVNMFSSWWFITFAMQISLKMIFVSASSGSTKKFISCKSKNWRIHMKFCSLFYIIAQVPSMSCKHILK